jgi:hypothetical protein
MAVKQPSGGGFSVGQLFQDAIDAKPEWLPWPVAILFGAVVLFAVVFPLAFVLWDNLVLSARGG